MAQHEQFVSKSFSPNAKAYLTSPVHAAGADLNRLAHLVAAHKEPRVLDLGCGAGHATFAVAPFAREVVAFDLIGSMLEVTAAAAAERDLGNVVTQQGSVEELPFADGQFDCVLSRYSAHHWKDVSLALREAKRVLKPGGVVCLIDTMGGPTPILDTHLQAVELLRDFSHIRSFTRPEWMAMFDAASLPGSVEAEWRLGLEFSSWIARIGTSPARVDAIRVLLSEAPAEVRNYFHLQDDLSFEIDSLMIVAHGA